MITATERAQLTLAGLVHPQVPIKADTLKVSWSVDTFENVLTPGGSSPCCLDTLINVCVAVRNYTRH